MLSDFSTAARLASSMAGYVSLGEIPNCRNVGGKPVDRCGILLYFVTTESRCDDHLRVGLSIIAFLIPLIIVWFAFSMSPLACG